MTTESTAAARTGTAPVGVADATWPAPRLAQRIEAEYLEMPGLVLTLAQAARLWGLDARQSERVLAGLVERGFLMRDRRGAYRRRGCPRCA